MNFSVCQLAEDAYPEELYYLQTTRFEYHYPVKAPLGGEKNRPKPNRSWEKGYEALHNNRRRRSPTFSCSRKDIMRISLSMIANPFWGKHIMAHELGHVLSHFFVENKSHETSYAKYLELRQCSNNFTVNKYSSSRTGFDHPHDHRKSEEEMADLISYLTFPDKSQLWGMWILKFKGN